MSTSRSTPPWVREHLIRTGVVDSQGVSRRARIRHCRCGLAVWAGFDGDVVAITGKADPSPLSPLGEALAQIAGRRTFSLDREAGGYVLNARTSWRIAAKPAGSGRFDVLAEHVCEAVAELPGLDSAFQPTESPIPERCPF